MVVARFEVYLVKLDPAVGAETRKTRPCVILSPDDLNARLLTVIIAPLTGVTRPYPFRVDSAFGGKQGQVSLDQMRAVDKRRLVKRVGQLDRTTSRRIATALLEMFA